MYVCIYIHYLIESIILNPKNDQSVDFSFGIL